MRIMTICMFVMLILATGCQAQPVNSHYDQSLIPRMQKLTRAVDGYVRYRHPPVSMTTEEILLQSTADDPGLREPFTEFVIELSRAGNDSVLLVCDAERTYALMEDSGCTPEVDKQYLESSPVPCSFTLEPQEKCR